MENVVQYATQDEGSGYVPVPRIPTPGQSEEGVSLEELSKQVDTTSTAGKMISRLLSVVAEFETDLRSEDSHSCRIHISWTVPGVIPATHFTVSMG